MSQDPHTDDHAYDHYEVETTLRHSVGAGIPFSTVNEATGYAVAVAFRYGLGVFREGKEGGIEPEIRVDFDDTASHQSEHREVIVPGDTGVTHVIQLGSAMRDQLTVIHEVAHAITKGKTATFEQPGGDVTHGQAFTEVFEGMLAGELPKFAVAMKALQTVPKQRKGRGLL